MRIRFDSLTEHGGSPTYVRFTPRKRIFFAAIMRASFRQAATSAIQLMALVGFCPLLGIQQTASASISINMPGNANRGTSIIVEAGGGWDPNTAARTLRTNGGCLTISVT